MSAPRACRRLLTGLASVAIVAGAHAAQARADSQIASFTATTSTQAAGAHPDLAIDLGVATTDYPPTTGDGGIPHPAPNEYLSQVAVQLPPGLLANAAALPTCGETVAEIDGAQECPAASEVGTFQLTFANQFITDPVTGLPVPTGTLGPYPIINEAPLPGEAARFVIVVGYTSVVIHIDVTVADQSDYGAVATVSGITSALGVDSVALDFWGVPSSPSHDGQRLACFDGNEFTSGCTAPAPGLQTFLVNPTNCPGTPAPVTASVDFYGDPTTYTATSDLPPTTGCASLPFAPSFALGNTTALAGQPDAFTADLSVPQDDPNDTSGGATSALQGASVQLPAGLVLNPSTAGGLSSCSDAQFAFGVHVENACPATSEIGTVSVTTPYLSEPLTGDLFVGAQESDDPSSGNMYRLFLEADGSGVLLKLVGSVSANPSTGQLSVSFPDDPQVQFSNLQLAFKGGARAPLVNPYACGTATAAWSMTPYSNPTVPVTGSSSFSVTGDCGVASQFSPTLTAGTVSDKAGGSSPFSFTLTRPDGQQWMSGIPSVVLPTGLLADVASVTPCPSAAAATGACPASSQVGTTSISTGAGSEPFNLTGQPVYLTGPYEGAPYGLADVVSGVAGPFDVGTVVVRQAIYVNPTTAQLTIKSDPLPTMLGGVPLDLQQVSIDIDRPGFMRSPTSCTAKTITAQVQGSVPGQPATVESGTYTGFAPSSDVTTDLSAPMRMGDCGALTFSPRLSLTASGKGQTRTGSHPTLTARLTQPAGQANLSSARVALPLSLALDPNNSSHVCSVKAAARIACPTRTIVGHATAITRVLPHPLSGKVYLVQGERAGPHGTVIRTLPTLLVPLRGTDGVAINLRAKTSVNSQEQLVTTFSGIPDAGIRSFSLTISGGKHGILVVTGSRDLCTGNETASIAEDGQNGKANYATQTLDRPACRASTHHTGHRS